MRLPFAITIKSYMVVFLLLLGLASVFTLNNPSFLVQAVFAAVLAAAIDVIINFVKIKKTILPSSAIISGLFIGLILPPSASPAVLASAAFLAVLSKHVIKFHRRHVFNPAAFGIVVSGLIFGLGASWWGAITYLVIPLGLIIVYRQRKWFLVFSFIIAYSLVLVLQDLQNVMTISFIDTTMLFFAFFMLLEPMTSTNAKNAMVAQGILVAVLASLFRIFLPSVDLYLAALLVSNVFVEALNKKLRPRARTIQETPRAPPIAAA